MQPKRPPSVILDPQSDERLSLFGDKAQGSAVDAISQSCRLRSIGKYVSKMGVAAIAGHFRSPDEKAAIILLADDFLIDRSEKRWPTGSRVEFCFGIE